MLVDEPERLAQLLIDILNEITSIGESKSVLKKECANLTRRVKLLAPLFEELREIKGPIPQDAIDCFTALEGALQAAKQLLKLGHDGSKLFLVLERDKVANQFHGVTAQLEQALSGLPYDQLEISDEVREQVELVHAQLKRAKGRADTPDLELYMDLSTILLQKSDRDCDRILLGRAAEKLQLKTIADLKQESQALCNMVSESGGDTSGSLEQVSGILRKLKDFVLTENPEMDAPDNEKGTFAGGASLEKADSPVIPDDFRCPISLELMKDPVIVATGQTYDRSCIQKWLDAGHKTCPKTQQTLPHLVLTPNYVLRSLIAQWCEARGIELPKRSGPSRNRKTAGSVPDMPGDRATVDDPEHLAAARSLGAYTPLTDLAQNGTARAKRKAASLLEHMNKQEVVPLT